MRSSLLGAGLIALALAGLALLPDVVARPDPVPPKNGPVKLAVLVVFDQMRGDYLQRWRPLFGNGGFQRLMREGVWFDHCHYPYAATFTGPGHASIATGCSPAIHGIIANTWYDVDHATSAYCATEDRYTPVPPPPPPKPNETRKKPIEGGSSGRLLAPTLADALKGATQSKGRVFSLSIKDRAAVLPGGKEPDFCLWFSSEQSKWISSTFYKNPPAWVAKWNEGNPAEKYFDKVWEKLEGIDHLKYAGPDDGPGEGAIKAGFGPTFPHAIVGDKDRSTRSRNEAVVTTPFGNDLLMEAIEKLFDEQKPGTGETPELLLVSFSSNDLCGHLFGPDSQEVLDITVRSDRIVERLLNLLDAKVGKGNYSLALTADHGVCPIPELSVRRGLVAQRIDQDLLKKQAAAYLRATFPTATPEQTEPIAFFDGDMVYFNRAWLKNSGLEPAKVEETVARWFRQQPGIAAAFPRSYLMQAAPPGASAIEQRVRRNWMPERSGDILIVPAPYCFVTTYPTGTTHGTPHDYDRHVPLLVLSPGLTAPGETRTDAVTPQAASVILARTLGIAPPARAEVGVPAGLFAR
jgi:predicted AlkP superfamily pyrophosphatase or phosphodiesterase